MTQIGVEHMALGRKSLKTVIHASPILLILLFFLFPYFFEFSLFFDSPYSLSVADRQLPT